MERPKHTRPNIKLRRERSHRGWTQNELAKQIGSDPKVVSRWERGATPGKFYQQALCALFGKTVEELGFLEEGMESRSEVAQPESQQLLEHVPQMTDQSENEQPPGVSASEEQSIVSQEEMLLNVNQFQQIILHLQKESLEDFRWKELKEAYLKLLTVSEARLKFVGTVEALRRYNGVMAYQRLPEAKAECDQAEQAFDEGSVHRILALFDNNKVWWHYYRATDAYQEYCKRTKELVEQAMQPRSPLSVIVPRLHIMLNPSLDDDPATRKIYEQIYSTMNAMQKAMNKRLRL